MAGTIRGITIDIGGDTSKLSKALASVNKDISNTQKQLKDVNKLLKLDPNNTELLRQKQGLLADAIGETKTKLDALKQASLEAEKQLKIDPSTQDSYDAIQREIIDTENKLKDLQKQAVESNKTIAAISNAGEKLKAAGDGIQNAGRALAPISAAATAGLGYAVKEAADFDAQMSKVQAISGASTEDMEALRDKAREMGAATKFSAQEAGEGLEYMAMAGWKTDQMLAGIQPILNLAAASGEELGTTSDIVTDALTAFGLQAEDAGHFADVLAAASSNANTNVSMMGESFKYAAPVAGALGYDVEDVAVALGLMANAGIKSSQAGTSLRNIFQRMAKPTKESEMAMKRLGLSMADDEGNMYSFMEIMEQIRDSMGNIKMPMEEYEKQLDYLDGALEAGSITQKQYTAAVDELNMQTFGAEGAEKARAAAMLGGARAMSALLAISNASEEDFNKLSSAVSNSSQQFAQLADGSIVPMNEALASGQEIIATYNGEAEKMSAIMLNNLNGSLTILKSGISELAISIGEALMPVIMGLVAKIQEVVNWFNGLSESQKTIVAIIGVVIAALAPLLIIIGTLISSVGTIMTAVTPVATFISGTLIPAITALGAPIIALIAVIATLVAAFVHFYLTNEEFRNQVQAAWKQVQNIITTVVGVVKSVISAFVSAVSAVWQRFGQQIMTIVQTYWQIMLSIIQQVLGVIQNSISAFISAVNAFWQAHGQTISTVTSTVWNAISAVISTVLNGIKAVLTAVLQAINGDWSGAWNTIKEFASTTLNNILSTVSSIVGRVKEVIVEKVGEAVNFLKELPAKALQWGKDLIDNFVDGIKSTIGKVTDVVGDVADAVGDFLGFSEPEKGRLSNFHTFAPDMMKLFAQGIRDNEYLVTDQIANLASAISGGLNADKSATVNVTTNTYLDGRLIASQINSQLGAML